MLYIGRQPCYEEYVFSVPKVLPSCVEVTVYVKLRFAGVEDMLFISVLN